MKAWGIIIISASVILLICGFILMFTTLPDIKSFDERTLEYNNFMSKYCVNPKTISDYNACRTMNEQKPAVGPDMNSGQWQVGLTLSAFGFLGIMGVGMIHGDN